jgi:peptide subunit release factor 1 (eRF1)
VEDVLHPYLRERLCERLPVGVGADLGQIRTAVLALEQQIERREEARAVDQLRQSVGSGQRALAGLGPVLQALSECRVEQLLVSAGFSATGWHCSTCDRLCLVGPRCPGCQSDLAPVDDVVEEAVEVALSTGCKVEVCVDNADLDVMGRIGALLRY